MIKHRNGLQKWGNKYTSRGLLNGDCAYGSFIFYPKKKKCIWVKRNIVKELRCFKMFYCINSTISITIEIKSFFVSWKWFLNCHVVILFFIYQIPQLLCNSYTHWPTGCTLFLLRICYFQNHFFHDVIFFHNL